MSRTRVTSTSTPSPIVRVFEWDSTVEKNQKDNGFFKSWNKENKENDRFDELQFVVLDERASVGGFNEALNAGIYSNLVSNITKETLTIRAGKKELWKDVLYADIKEKMKDKGAHFVRNVLSLVKIGDNWEICDIRFKGAGLMEWMEFVSETDELFGVVVTAQAGETRKKGKVNYVVPAFESAEIDAKLSKLADKADETLQDYYDKLKEGSSNTPAKSEPEADAAEEEEDDLPF